MGGLIVQQKVVNRFLCYFANIHHFDVVLNRVHLFKANARLGVELLVWPRRDNSNGVLDHVPPWICFSAADHVDHSVGPDVCGAQSRLERSLLVVRRDGSIL